jgi:hypothetical protein
MSSKPYRSSTWHELLPCAATRRQLRLACSAGLWRCADCCGCVLLQPPACVLQCYLDPARACAPPPPAGWPPGAQWALRRTVLGLREPRKERCCAMPACAPAPPWRDCAAAGKVAVPAGWPRHSCACCEGSQLMNTVRSNTIRLLTCLYSCAYVCVGLHWGNTSTTNTCLRLSLSSQPPSSRARSQYKLFHNLPRRSSCLWHLLQEFMATQSVGVASRGSMLARVGG